MTRITITTDDRQIQAALAEASSRLTDLTPIMASVGEYMVGRTRERFDSSTAPNGQKWAPLAQATIDAKRRRQKGGTSRNGRSIARTNANPEDILKDTYLLRDTIAYQPTASSVAIGTPQKYGVHHQYGAPRRNIPARQFNVSAIVDAGKAISSIQTESFWLRYKSECYDFEGKQADIAEGLA